MPSAALHSAATRKPPRLMDGCRPEGGGRDSSLEERLTDGGGRSFERQLDCSTPSEFARCMPRSDAATERPRSGAESALECGGPSFAPVAAETGPANGSAGVSSCYMRQPRLDA